VVLILAQPDLGTALVYVPILLVMVLLGGVPVRHVVFIMATGALTVVLTVLPNYERIILGREYPVSDFLRDLPVMGAILGACGLATLLGVVGLRVLKRRYFLWVVYGGLVVTLSLLGALLLQRLLRPYQIMRFIIFLDPSIDPQGAGWNILQSRTAVGSGGLWGKGFLGGTQSHLRYLPQQSTDFIFSILAEEWGFLGGLLVFALFLVILLRGIRIMYIARDDYGMYVAAGVVGMIFFHVVINVGMAMGIMPITGIPLFFLSYGGSSLWTALIGVGLLLDIYFRRYGH
jgi:rod shape determining protein RodA